MRLSIAALTLAVLAGQSSLALATDMNNDRPDSHKQMMRDCMKQERQSNPTESKRDMRRTCHEKIKSNYNNPNETASPSENQTTPPPQNQPMQQ